MTLTADTRSLFKADAAFEALFGTALVACAAAGVLARGDTPVARTVIIGVGISFLLASAGQFIYFINRPRRVLLELAVGNAGMALAGSVWLLLDHPFSVAGATFMSVVIAWKLAIGLLQLRSLMPNDLR